jgi:sugar O-acyltransferase (sialic acid O-acetyltransferase NeuD family)
MKKALIGAGGFADEIKAHMCDFNMVCFVDDIYYTQNEKNIKPLLEFNPTEYEVLVAVGNPIDRLNIVNKLPKDTRYFSFIHNSVQILGNDVKIGNGSFIGGYSILTTNIQIGNHSMINRGCQIGHDSVMGNYLSMMPNSTISGNCKIGNNVYFGTNSSVKQKIQICDDVTIGLNAGVVKNINEPGVYAGVPAIKIK